jgi:hypothetical protein
VSTWNVQLTKIADDSVLVDFSNLFQSASVNPRANKPRVATAIIPGDIAGIRTINIDGDRNLVTGTRALKIKRDGTLWAHCKVWDLDGNGDENQTSIAIAAYDPLVDLYSRWVRDSTGDLAKPDFSSPISGAAMIKQAIENSVTFDGALPIDTSTGTFDTAIPPAVDLSAELANWPLTIGDLIDLLTKTGVCDVVAKPVDTSLGYAAGVLVALSVRNKAGTDRSATVHFDYATGDHSVSKFRFTESMGNPQQTGGGLCNKLWYELGPRIDQSHWAGNITATETTPDNLAAYLALENASRAKYGVFHDIRILDAYDENNARKMWHQLWKREVKYRVVPVQRAYITPIADAPFKPVADYDVFDTVALNAADLCGPQLVAVKQRIYGYTASKQGPDSVERVSELISMVDDE